MEPYRFSVDEYHRLLDAEVFRRGARTELIEGMIVSARTRTERRVTALALLRERLAQATPAELSLRAAEPLTLSSATELSPDFTLVRHDDVRRAVRYPATAALVIEVVDDEAPVSADRLSCFAKAELDEVWRVNATTGRVDLWWKPVAGQHRDALVLDRPAELTARTVPTLTISLSGVFG